VYGRREKRLRRGRNRGKLHNIVQYFAIEKSAKRREPTKIGREPENRKFNPPPRPLNLEVIDICLKLPTESEKYDFGFVVEEFPEIEHTKN